MLKFLAIFLKLCAGRRSGLADPRQPLRRGEPESEPAGKLQPLGGDPRRARPDADHGAGNARPVLRLERVRGAARRADGGDGAAAAGLHAAAADDDDDGPGTGAGGPPPDANAAEPREPVRQPLRGRRRAPLRRRRHAAPRWPRQRLHGADLVPRQVRRSISWLRVTTRSIHSFCPSFLVAIVRRKFVAQTGVEYIIASVGVYSKQGSVVSGVPYVEVIVYYTRRVWSPVHVQLRVDSC